MKQTPQSITVITGSTASGKSALAFALAKKMNGQIVSADSMQIYRRMNIGTAKPNAEERREVVHHMIDIAEPWEDYSVGLYREKADKIIDGLLSDGTPTIVCGGTGLYIDALLFEHSFGGAARDDEYRKALQARAETEGNAVLYETLKSEDSESARTLHPNDVKRVIRALEILKTTGKKKSEQSDGLKPPRRDYRLFVLTMPREILYEKINKRVGQMIANGLIEETERLKAEGISADQLSMKAIGYAEVLRYLNGDIKKGDMIELIQQNTRNYAKRQITYFKKLRGAEFADAETVKKILTLETQNLSL
ncbi:MAG: tRNA (adenosine(37)-N6)-dimethylallyltransferase MiaA [Clostridiales bacterium]|jgi:tRNA dimethylallyltransferase|nr:tRNA (adenosine(37)-N6)-dimethylallyltransferase MiaA [Clostridiales bacterium]